MKRKQEEDLEVKYPEENHSAIVCLDVNLCLVYHYFLLCLNHLVSEDHISYFTDEQLYLSAIRFSSMCIFVLHIYLCHPLFGVLW